MVQQSAERSLVQQRITLDSILAIQRLGELAAPADLIYSHLANGGSHDMAIDASGADVSFRYTVPVGRIAELHRLNFWGTDNAKAVPNGFFSIAALGIGDGILIRLMNADDSVLFDFADGDEIRHHSHLGMLAGIDVLTDTTANLSGWTARWTLALGPGGPIVLSAGQYFEVLIRGDLGGLEEFEAMVQGRLRDA